MLRSAVGLVMVAAALVGPLLFLSAFHPRPQHVYGTREVEWVTCYPRTCYQRGCVQEQRRSLCEWWHGGPRVSGESWTVACASPDPTECR